QLNPAVAKHASALAAAQSLKVKFTYRELTGAPSDCSLEYSKPNMFRIETPDRLTVSDGKKTWDLNKAAKTYTEADATLKRTTDRDVDAWSPFFQKEPYKDITRATAGGTRAVAGV